MKIWINNLLRVLFFGWNDSTTIASREDVRKSKISIFIDMIRCYRKYLLLSSQYAEYEFYKLKSGERAKLGNELKEKNYQRNKWEKVYYQNWCFLNKYSSPKWSTSLIKKVKRNREYTKRFGLGKGCSVQFGVKFICEHFSEGKLSIGNNVFFARDVDVDYTADLTIGDGTMVSEGVKLLTHNHAYLNSEDDHGLILSPLTIQDHVFLGARVIVLPGVQEIGRGSLLSTGAVIRKRVPPYAIVSGNPSKVVGFRFSPEQIVEYEEEQYPEKERIPIDILENNYKKYYLDRLSDIKSFLNY